MWILMRSRGWIDLRESSNYESIHGKTFRFSREPFPSAEVACLGARTRAGKSPTALVLHPRLRSGEHVVERACIAVICDL